MAKPLLIAVALLLLAQPCWADQPVEVFFLTIGVGSYAKPPADFASGPTTSFGDTPNGPWSAHRLAYALNELGAVDGIELVGKDGKLVRRSDIFDALDATIEKAKRSSNPFLLFYFNGHGIGEGMAWNLFAVPGDFIGPYTVEDPEALAAHTVHAAEAVHRLDESGIPFMVLLDHCYEGTETNFPKGILSSIATQNLNDTLAILRVVNQFRNENPVLFSARPGSTVPSVADPHPLYAADRSVGPLARRLLMALMHYEGREIELTTLVGALTDDPDLTGRSAPLDTLTAPALTFVSKPLPEIRFHRRAAAPAIEIHQGSGRTANLAPFSSPSEEEDSVATAPAPKQIRLEIWGTQDDFVTEGAHHELTLTSEMVEYFEMEAERSISVIFQYGDLSGVLDLEAPPGSRFAEGRYAFTNASSFDDQWGFELFLDGRGCNQTRGVLEIERMHAREDRPERFESRFEQICDDNGVAKGRLDILW